ncbi:MAG TPA: ABC transporter ATP-binding protein [Tepidisphaeraceae bacterium]|nr:ABC transporter ATP-binding protein [Tepidisphaeraceae bacterium]
MTAARVDTPSIVATEDLTHRYGDRVALDGVSLSVAAGEVLALLGPNGSGKTTLFRILSTLIPPQEGTAMIDGLDLRSQAAAVRSRIGVVFQSPSLDKQLTAAENLRHHGHLFGLRGEALRSRMDELLSRVNLAERSGERVSRFSGGMRRRVEIAKALLTRPRVLLMDEPSTGLDPAARHDVWTLLREARQREGVTILLTTHLMDEADACDRVAVINDGKLVACDAPAALKDRVGGDVMTVATSDPPALMGILREKLSLEAIADKRTVRLERPRAHELVPAVVAAAPGLVDSISVAKPTLEDVFLHLTGRHLDANADAAQ